MRVVSGQARGLRLRVPKGTAVRPTADRVKEALFAMIGERVQGARVLDLFAGSGGLGIEALSRGAGQAVFVDVNRRCLGAVRDNLQRARLTDRAELITGDARRVLSSLAERGCVFDLIFVDPPYGHDLVPLILQKVATSAVLAPTGWVVIESGSREEITAPLEKLAAVRTRCYGETRIVVYTHVPSPEPVERNLDTINNPNHH